MTCIVTLKTDEGVFMGGDSAAVERSALYARKRVHPKVFRNGAYLIGYTSSFRMGQLLEHKIILPDPSGDGDLMHFMCTTFIDSIRRGFKENGFSTIESNNERGGCFLVAVEDRVFMIDDDFQVGEELEPYSSVGCGMEYALGALRVLQDVEGFSPTEQLEKALEAAEYFSIGVLGPFHIMEL